MTQTKAVREEMRREFLANANQAFNAVFDEWVALRDAEVEAFKQGHLPRAHAGAPGAAAVMVATRYCVGVRAGLY